ncbi:hypothetical protein [Slackia isoflavoniconvertens]|uniref:Polysaccharide biosynthesis protein n=1 Tax=Slackia isoflavoniconvertens TaxID=572010 RepID=A0A3N0I6Q4_9ACTN|nr:hypothetical protein [Slackia isoflavoniconvertens]MBB3280004.1 O-antigen/teichoic acid export membrane protein [Slackia isoflavoniconvertens]RNM32695.1 hypothetical protein DMP05_09495 [Slackia isoflavoniconvertens]
MDIKKLSIDIAIAILSQGANALVSALLTLLLPKLLGVEGFGYWQLFIFYASYVGLFHLGLNDGVYLVEGGRGRNEIDKRSINSQFFFGAVIELFFSLALIVFAVFVPLEYDRKIVILATGILVPVCNTATFIGYVHQAMNETKLYSYSVLGESLVLLLGLILLMADGCTDYMTYIELYLIAKILRLLFCAVFFVDFFKSGFLPLKETVRLSIADIRVGVSLMVANIAGSLVVGIARFAIDGNWDIATFSVASLALSITTFFMMFISQASMVLFPSLRQSCDINLGIAFRKMRDGLNLVLPLLLLAFYPAKYFLEIWLPDYQSAIGLFLFVFPLCIFEGKMDILGTTFLKVFRMEKSLLRINLASMLATFALVLVSIFIFHSVESILLSTVIVLCGRELYTEFIISRKLQERFSSCSFLVVLLSLLFVGVASIASDAISALLYVCAYILYSRFSTKGKCLS